jgi:hypothetical protein
MLDDEDVLKIKRLVKLLKAVICEFADRTRTNTNDQVYVILNALLHTVGEFSLEVANDDLESRRGLAKEVIEHMKQWFELNIAAGDTH